MIGRWFRVYAELIDDPKFIKLGPDLRSALLMMWCVASKNNGILPPLDDIAIAFRLNEPRTEKLLMELERSGFIDRTEDGLSPHNWNARQFKTETSTERVKRFRKRQRNGNETVSETPPDTDTDTDTKTDTKKHSEPNGSGVETPSDARTRLFRNGLAKLSAMTGKGPDACRSFVGKCLKEVGDDAVEVLAAIEEAERNRVVNPSAWIAAKLKSKDSLQRAKPLTQHQIERQETREILNDLQKFIDSSDGSDADSGVLRRHSGDGQESVHGGVRGAIIDLSPSRNR